MYTLIVDAQEGHTVVIVNMSAHFFQTDIDIMINWRGYGQLTLLLVKKKSSNNKDIPKRKNDETLNTANFVYLKVMKHFTDLAIKMKPYEPCISNKKTNIHHFSIIVDADDIKLLYVVTLVVPIVIW